MQKTLLDTDIFSEIIKGKHAAVTARVRDYETHYGSLTITALTVVEVTGGLHRKGETTLLTRFLSRLATTEVLPLDADAAVIAGRIYSDLEGAGRPIGSIDPMIAGVAIHHGLPLATGNTEHFERVRALGYPLVLVNWKD